MLALVPAAAALASCSTVATPVLRHETGEVLGPGKFRIYAHYESGRIFAPSIAQDTWVVEQENSVFQGSLLGVQGDLGILPKLDAQLGFNLSSGGGGWRVGAKYGLLQRGRLALAAMAGYGVGSGKGTVTYLTTETPRDVDQTLSVYTMDLSVPVSFRLAPYLAVYSGVIFLHSGASGSFSGGIDGTFVSDSFNDLGMNLGFKFNYRFFEGDLEVAYLRVHDPFLNTERLVPYIGASFGVTF